MAFLAISFAFGCRRYVKSRQGFQWATGVQTFFWWIIPILFLIFDWNKLHILWVAPICFFSAQFLVIGGIPILSNVVMFATKMFLGIVLFGIEKPTDNSQPFNDSDADKIHFIKNLAKRRIMNDPIASMIGNIDDLSDTMILGLPEATIVYIVDTYQRLRRQGYSKNKSLEAIENHRASFGDSGALPSPLTLQNYIKYRLKIEHSEGAPISQEFIYGTIKEAVGFFAEEVESKDST